MAIRKQLLEVDFINDIYIVGEQYQTLNINTELKKRFFEKVVDPFWHTEKDNLEYIVFYDDGKCLCQRKKLKFDFSTNTNIWSTYSFYEATPEQIAELKKQLDILFEIINEIKENRVLESIEKIDKEVIYFDQKYLKKMGEKNSMLAASDWRILPDIVDSYSGEKDMWMKWRDILRKQVIKKPTEFESPLEFLKDLYEVKYPIDPAYYRKKYPEGEVEYLSTEDQWVITDIESSSDFVASRLLNWSSMRGQYTESYRRIRSEVMNIMKLLEVDNMSNIKFNRYTEED